MKRLVVALCLLGSIQVRAAEEIQIALSLEGDTMRLYNQLSLPNVQSNDENGNSVLTRTFTSSDAAAKVSCRKILKGVVVKHSCTFTATLGSAVKISPTGAVIADLNDADSSKLFNTLVGLKTYSSLEEVPVKFNGKDLKSSRLGIHCPNEVTNMGLKRTGPCRIAAFR